MAGKCPICSKEVKKEFFPFCSPGCKDRDLLNWLGGAYAIAGSANMSDDDNEVKANDNEEDENY